MNIYLQYLLAALAAYLIGAFPTGVVTSKLVGGPDVRYVGSGHTGGTNTMRQTTPLIGALVVVVDGLKGLLAWGVAILITLGSPAALPLAATLAVIGHCWPVYTRFHGGMGLATGGAIILFASPWTIAVIVPVWAVFYFPVFKKQFSPRCVILSMPIAALVSILFFPLAINVKWMLALLAIILVIRHLPEWNRVT